MKLSTFALVLVSIIAIVLGLICFEETNSVIAAVVFAAGLAVFFNTLGNFASEEEEVAAPVVEAVEGVEPTVVVAEEPEYGVVMTAVVVEDLWVLRTPRGAERKFETVPAIEFETVAATREDFKDRGFYATSTTPEGSFYRHYILDAEVPRLLVIRCKNGTYKSFTLARDEKKAPAIAAPVVEAVSVATPVVVEPTQKSAQAIAMELAHKMTREYVAMHGGVYRAIFKDMLKRVWALKTAEDTVKAVEGAITTLTETLDIATRIEDIQPSREICFTGDLSHAEEFVQVLEIVRNAGFDVWNEVANWEVKFALKNADSFARKKVGMLLESKDVLKFILSDESVYYFFN